MAPWGPPIMPGDWTPIQIGIVDQIERIARRRPCTPARVFSDTAGVVGIDRHDVLDRGAGLDLVTGTEREPRFGLTGEAGPVWS
ncbi:MAG: hypothetical protein AB1806_20415 [Acidobacteriota bacterium]